MVKIRSFFKFLFRYTHSREFRHSENLWPYFSVLRNSFFGLKEVRYKFKKLNIIDVMSVLGKERGRVVVFATGPSASKVTEDFFVGKKVFGVNGAFNSHVNVFFDYYCVIDRSFASKNATEIAKITNGGTVLFTTLYCLSDVLLNSKLKINANNVCIVENVRDKPFEGRGTSKINLEQAAQSGLVELSDVGCGYSYSLGVGFFDGGTVAFAALQIAHYLGFREIDIVGLDLSVGPEQVRFYDEKSPEPSRLGSDFECKILPSFKLAAKVFKKEEMRVVNYSIDSKIPGDLIEKRHFI